MKYDFDTPVNRKNTNSLKWNVKENGLPMWVADMDFRTAPEIMEVIREKMNQGIFGYSVVPAEWYEAIIGWWKDRHHFEMRQEWLLFCSGVLPAIASAIRRFSCAGDYVVTLTPIFGNFTQSIVNNGRIALESPLSYDGETYQVDFADLEEKLSNPRTTLMIVCNPHNPLGKVWDRETLEQIGELCWKHHVTVICDEIHCALTDPGCDYTPFASVSEKCGRNSVTCIAPTKAFNLAGLHTSALIVPDEKLRDQMRQALITDEEVEPSIFAIEAAIAAFTKGGPWLDELREYLYQNKCLVKEYIEKEIPQIKVVPSKGTYLLWLDCQNLPGNGDEFCRFLQEREGLYLSAGLGFGKNGGRFMRMNVACPRASVEEGLRRLKAGANAYLEQRKE